MLVLELDTCYTVRYSLVMEAREYLLHQALHLFSSRGYDAVGVQGVVEAAGVTKPTLYHHFGSKRGLLDALLEEHFEPLNESLRRAADYRGDLPLTLTRVSLTFFAEAEREPSFARLRLALLFAPLESEACGAVTPWLGAQQKVLENMFEAASRDHGNMRGRHHAYAASFLGLLNTYVSLALGGHEELNEPLSHRIVHQFMHGIFS